MRLSDLQSIDEEIEMSPAEMRAYEMEGLEPEITPLSPEWGPTIFYDPEIFPNPISFERVERHYADAYPGRHFSRRRLSIGSLQQFAIARYPIVEERFRRRGFVSDIEVTSFQTKDHHPETTYLAVNRAATYFQFTLIAHILSDPDEQVTEAVKRSADLARLMDGYHIRRDDVDNWIPAPLVERDGVFSLGEKLLKDEMVHFAHRWSPLLAVQHGLRDAFGFCRAMPDEIAAQVQFECQNSRAFFGGASGDAVRLWQKQVLAVLRKAVWEVELTTGVPFSKREIVVAKAQAKALKRLLADRKATVAHKVTTALDEVLNDQAHAYCEAMGDENELTFIYGPSLGSEKYHYGLTTEQNVISGLHGATYEPEFDGYDREDPSDPLRWLKPVAGWIGQLKRHRHAVLTKEIAENLAAIFGEFDPDAGYDGRLRGFAAVIEDRLSDVAWSLIAGAIPAVLDGAEPPVSVVYDWTRNVEEPWSAERREDGTIVIRGPLLDFPVSRTTDWNAKALTMAEGMEHVLTP